MEAIILAGGKGTRLRSAVSDRPKPLADVNGIPFIFFILEYLKKNNCSHFIISTGFKKEMIRAAIGNNFSDIPVSYVEETEPLGTGGAFLKAVQSLRNDQPFLFLNGDTSFEVDVSLMFKKLNQTSALICMALFCSGEEGRYDQISLENNLVRISESPRKANVGEMAYGGISLVSSKNIKNYFHANSQTFSYEDQFLVNIINNGATITGELFSNEFTDIGVPQDYFAFCGKNRR